MYIIKMVLLGASDLADDGWLNIDLVDAFMNLM